MPVMPAEDSDAPVQRPVARSLDIVLDRTPVRKLEFVDIDPTPVRPPRRRAATGEAGAPVGTATATDAAISDGAASSFDPGEPRWSLWGDAEV